MSSRRGSSIYTLCILVVVVVAVNCAEMPGPVRYLADQHCKLQRHRRADFITAIHTQ